MKVLWRGAKAIQKVCRFIQSQSLVTGDQEYCSGMFVDTPAGFAAAPAGDKYKLLKACVEAFESESRLSLDKLLKFRSQLSS